MQNTERILHLDICDYRKRKICPLYSSNTDVAGQAVDIFRTTERNGWKELSFTLPSTCMTEHGVEDNYRLEHLKADFLIRAIDERETDWYIISSPKVKHNAYSKKVQVTAGHVSQLLKLKNLGLEFSDDEGNNVGTAEELLTTILSGTGWTVGYVYPFAEKNGDPKRRSLKASAKTGAFKLVSMMCDLFDAKPIYHGDSRTVDIVPMNPFSEPQPGKLPDLTLANNVVELHYGKNVSNVERTENTDNIVTKLYAYGSYGDKTSGYCGIDECTHVEYKYILTQQCAANETYYFSFTDEHETELTYHFTPYDDMPAGGVLIYSLLDPSSKLYIWDDNNQNAYPVSKGTKGVQLPANSENAEHVPNWFQFVMNFDYYRAIGLMTDDMIQSLGKYQRDMPRLYETVSAASMAMSDIQSKISEIVGVVDFCKLDIERVEPLIGDGYVTLVLDKNQYKDGVIYRTDYDKNKDNRFKWRTTDYLNEDGDPINSAAGVVYIVHNTNPITWNKAYLKEVHDEDNPDAITLWAPNESMEIDVDNDQFFLFAYNGINGWIGSLESNDEAIAITLEDATKVVTVDHPVLFTTANADSNPSFPSLDEVSDYGWVWKEKSSFMSSSGEWPTCWFSFPGAGHSKYWWLTYFSDKEPVTTNQTGLYWFNWRNSTLYHRESGKWVALTSSLEQKVAAMFPTVFMCCMTRDQIHSGLSSQYQYVASSDGLPAGNYYIENEYKSYWAFTVKTALSEGDTLTYHYDKARVIQISNDISTTIKPKNYRFDNVKYHPLNILDGKGIEPGEINSSGVAIDSTTKHRSQSYISVIPSTKYIIDSDDTIVVSYYNDKQLWIKNETVNSQFLTPDNCTNIRICFENDVASNYSGMIMAADNAENIIVIEDMNYVKLNAEPIGDRIGLIDCIDDFVEYANDAYGVKYEALKNAQMKISEAEQDFMLALGDIYREGWWNDANYVDGDEDKLYEDSLDNLNQISKPEATYSITYLDTREANIDNCDYGASGETVSVMWPDISDMDAVHLVDPELAINTWAFLDKNQKCHDKPWQTKISINTNLSTISQHSFTDVMTNIANVASEIKGKTSYYDKTIGSSAHEEDVNKLTADLFKNEKQMMSALSRVEEIGQTVITHSSQIKQTENEISAEVKRSTEQNTYLSSQLKISTEAIATEVSRAQNAEKVLSSAITQTATEINAEVKRVENAAAANLKVTADGLAAEVSRATKAEGSLSTDISRVEQTASGISTRVQTIENTSIIKQTAEAIQAVVRDNSNGNNEFNTSSVSISQEGVSISTDGSFSVSAGDDEESSAVVIDKNGVAIGSSGVLTVQTDNFEVTPDGKISANDAIINGQISNNGYPVLAKNYDIYIGSSEPDASIRHTGMIWIKPGVPASGGGNSGGSGGSQEEVVVPTNKTVTFTGITSSSKRHWFYDEGSASVYLTADTYSVGSKSSYNYTVTIPVYLARRTDGQKHGAKFKVSLNGSVVLTTNKTWSESASSSNMTDTVTLSGTSSVWLGDLAGITAVISISRESTASYTGNIYLNSSQTVTAICS